MADSKISGLSDGSPLEDDDFLVVDRNSGSNQKIAATSLGWTNLTSTLTYSSADSPTFVATTSADLTGYIPVGARIRLKQGGSFLYFIVTAITSTTITLYGGTDYTLANSTITNPAFSLVKAPVGFPIDPAKWAVSVTNTSDLVVHTNPVAGTWYNGVSISVPIGCWRVLYQVSAEISRSGGAGVTSAYVTLSTANNSESEPQLSGIGYAASALTTLIAYIVREKFLTLAAKTTYFLNAKVDTTIGTTGTIEFRGDLQTTVIRAVCAYL